MMILLFRLNLQSKFEMSKNGTNSINITIQKHNMLADILNDVVKYIDIKIRNSPFVFYYKDLFKEIKSTYTA